MLPNEALPDRIHSDAASGKNKDYLFGISHRYYVSRVVRTDYRYLTLNFVKELYTSSCFPLHLHSTLAFVAFMINSLNVDFSLLLLCL